MLREKLNLQPIDWQNHKAVICLTHDVDSINDYVECPKIYQLNKQYGIKSTFNFLTHWGYEIDRSFIQELDKNGFEIGLHGYTHDLAIGIRPEERIKRELGLALQKINYPVRGYRAPAFSITPKLLKILKELGIKYDSSMKTVSCYGQAVETFYPYRFPQIGIWEIPLTIQDDRVFRDLHLSNEEGLGVIKEIAQRVINVGGVMVINNHPKLISEKLYYYEELLKWIVNLDNVWVATTGEIIDFMGKREKQITKNVSK
jgi:peptidoglycan/xylan/chitin deacetylase (PgdA/CDA1 family)